MPVDLWAVPAAADNLRTYLGLSDDEAVRQALQVDLRSVWPTYIGPDHPTFPDGSWTDWWGCRRAYVGGFDEVIASPLASAETLHDIQAYPWPDPAWFDVDELRDRCLAWRDYALVIRDPDQFATCVLRVAMYLRGMEQFMLDMALNPAIAHAVITHIETFYLELNRRILKAVGDLADIYFIADDVGMQSGLLISPDMFRRYVRPSLTRFIAQAHAHGLRVMYHTCGAVRQLIPDFIEIGVDILNPVQTSARGMEPAALKREYGDQLCFHGGVDLQTVLTRSTPAQVREHVQRLIETLGAGGGYILAPTNNLMPDTPVQNILAMYDLDIR